MEYNLSPLNAACALFSVLLLSDEMLDAESCLYSAFLHLHILARLHALNGSTPPDDQSKPTRDQQNYSSLLPSAHNTRQTVLSPPRYQKSHFPDWDSDLADAKLIEFQHQNPSSHPASSSSSFSPHSFSSFPNPFPSSRFITFPTGSLVPSPANPLLVPTSNPPLS